VIAIADASMPGSASSRWVIVRVSASTLRAVLYFVPASEV
jgi:hypothetical protein